MERERQPQQQPQQRRPNPGPSSHINLQNQIHNHIHNNPIHSQMNQSAGVAGFTQGQIGGYMGGEGGLAGCQRWGPHSSRTVAYLCDMGEGKLYSINAAAGVSSAGPAPMSGDGSRRVHCYIELRNSSSSPSSPSASSPSLTFSPSSSSSPTQSSSRGKPELWFGCEHSQCLPTDGTLSGTNLLTAIESRSRVLCPHALTMLEASLIPNGAGVVTAPAVDKLLDGSAVNTLAHLGLVEDSGIKDLGDLVLQAYHEADLLLLAVSPRVFSVFCSLSQPTPMTQIGWAGRFGRVHVYIHTWKKGPSKVDRVSQNLEEEAQQQEEDRVSTVKCECAYHQTTGRCVHATLVLWFLLSIKQDAIIRSVLRYRMLFASPTLWSGQTVHGGGGGPPIPHAQISPEMERSLNPGYQQNSADFMYFGKTWRPRVAALAIPQNQATDYTNHNNNNCSREPSEHAENEEDQTPEPV